MTHDGAAPPRVVLASRNAHKLVELRRILAATGVPVELVGLDEFPDAPDVAETGLTFADNALLKADSAMRASGLPAVADDSGIEVDVLHGMPGVLSARWAGRHGDDQANLDLLLAQLSDIPAGHRGGAFVCAAALVLPGGDRHVVEGRVTGTITTQPRGTGGFGYDPIFVPDGYPATTAELSADDKDAISHRGRAFRELAPRLAVLLH